MKDLVTSELFSVSLKGMSESTPQEQKHPSREEFERYCHNPTAEEIRRIERHVGKCSECSLLMSQIVKSQVLEERDKKSSVEG